jgi:acyl-CoA thioesterase
MLHLWGMDEKPLEDRVLHQMLDHDPFSQWLGIACVHIGPGTCTLSLTVRPEMLNGFSIVHGGIAYAMADSALAFAANSHGTQCVSIETSISHLRPCHAGDELEALATEVNRSKNLALYQVEVRQSATRALVATFKGTVFRTGKPWFLESE